jgi:rubrerythrin
MRKPRFLAQQGVADMPGTSRDEAGADAPESTAAPQASGQADTTEIPGDAVCWLRLVCSECGAMAESEPSTKCPQCGAPLGSAR